MFKLSEIISKPVYSIYEGLFIGTIIDVCINKKTNKIRSFVVLDAEENEKNIIMVNKILNCNNDSIIIRNVSNLILNSVDNCNVINKMVYSYFGENLGKVKEVLFDKDYNVLSLETDKNISINFKNIFKIGEDVLFYNNSGKTIKISNYRPRIQLDNVESIKVNILNKEESTKIKSIGNETVEKNKTLTLPTKIAQNPNFLLGRKASISIKNDLGEFIIKKGEFINEKTIAKAQLCNKIYELSICAN